MDNKEYIKTVLDERTLWEQLAEESSKLTMKYNTLIDRMAKIIMLHEQGYKVVLARRSDRFIAIVPPEKILADKIRFKPRKQYYVDAWRWQG